MTGRGGACPRLAIIWKIASDEFCVKKKTGSTGKPVFGENNKDHAVAGLSPNSYITFEKDPHVFCSVSDSEIFVVTVYVLFVQ